MPSSAHGPVSDPENEEKLRYFLKKTMSDLRVARQRLAQVESRLTEPIAIVGMGCHLPGGVENPDELWDLVAGGVDAIGEFPTDRGWDRSAVYGPDAAADGRPTPFEGGFLDGATTFDAEFFGISPREAAVMDPQQRLVLETAWETLEHAAVIPADLRGSRTGVYVGVRAADWESGWYRAREAAGFGVTGGTLSVLSGRVAYHLGLEGPAVTVDTACSASLVAVHLAVQALRSGECELALAGGTTVMTQPAEFTSFSRQGALARDGRCRAFAAAADGPGFSEGVGLVLLQRLSDARRDGRRILAVVRGSAVNQDGASNGLTAPSGPSQQRVIRQALDAAGLTAADVDVLEAHGTGTRLGDPIEAQALLATYGRDRPADRPALLGALKSNIGHTQAAAGVAGLIKMVQAIRHGHVPPTLHVDRPTPLVDWDSGAIRLATEGRAWPETGRPRRAAVSAFGISGTNAHVIVEEAPVDEEPAPTGRVTAAPGAPMPWVLSARDPRALRGQARRLLDRLDREPRPEPAEVGHALAATRTPFEHRAVLRGRTAAEARSALAALAAGTADAALTVGVAAPEPGRTALLLTGQGAQRPGMGRELHAAFPVFAEAFDEACAAFEGLLPTPLRDVVLGADGAPGSGALSGTGLAQPALFAYETALYRLWRSWVPTAPDFLLGHSLGEITAAHLAGVLSLPDAARLVAARARLMQDLPAGGAMAAVAATEKEVAAELAAHATPARPAVIAAVNGPSSVVISGHEETVTRVVLAFADRGTSTSRLPVSHAFHSPLMEPMLDEFAEVLRDLTFAEPEIPLVTNLTGRVAEPGRLTTPQYWLDQIRQTVRFGAGVETLRAEGVTAFVEIGPDAVLTPAVLESLGTGPDALALAVQRRGGTARAHLDDALTAAFLHGLEVDWTRAFDTGGTRHHLDLPTYAFTRSRYWPTPTPVVGARATVPHPLIDGVVRDPVTGRLELTARLSTAAAPWLADHVVLGRVVVPGVVFVELALQAGREAGCPVVEELDLESPLLLPARATAVVRITLDQPGPTGRRALLLESRPADAAPDARWVRHATGTVVASAPAPEPATLTQWPPAGAVPLDGPDLYEHAADSGFSFGPSFRGLVAVWRRGDETFAEVRLAEELRERAGGYLMHPVLLDSTLHPLGLDMVGETRLPFAWNGVRLSPPETTTLRVRIGPASSGEGHSVTLADDRGTHVGGIDSLVMRAVTTARLDAAMDEPGDALYRVAWQPLPARDARPTPGRRLALVGHLPQPLTDLAPHYPDLAALAAVTGPGAATCPDTVVWCAPERPDLDPAAGPATGVREALLEIQRWLADDRQASSRLVVLTRNAVATDAPEPVDPAGAAIWGLVRAAQTEHPDRLRLVDWDGTPASADALRHALDDDRPQLVVRAGRCHAPRLTRATGQRLTPPAVAAWRLEPGHTGSLTTIRPVPHPAAEAPLTGGQIRVAVRAAGLNFRDVLNALGQLPTASPLGAEGAGVVTEVGPGVTGIAPGDRVMGLWPSALGPQVVADRRLVLPVPEDWTLAQAATVPMAFLTAYHALRVLADLRPGQTVLVHAAAGGVGMAATQIARHLGARVLATASPEKWPLLRSVGIAANDIASSRSLDFEPAFRQATDGHGVDVVLNALTGDFVDASLRLLAPGGRFVEMGVTDVRDPREVAAAHPGVGYDAFLVTDHGPDHLGRLLAELRDLFARGVLRPLPLTAWDIRRAPEAFRQMREGLHTGKLVLTVPRPLDPEGTVLVTGGSGTLAGEIATHLVARHGVRHLLLASRQGEHAPRARALRDELAARGARVTIAACDTADRAQVAALLDLIPAEHPLTAVVHTAGVLDDGVIEAMTPDRLTAVLAPKVGGAAHLDELTRRFDLSAFVLFSSVAGVLGSPGQSNYAAANAALDALAARRASAGLPATSLAWGLWAKPSGMTGSLDAADLARARRLGVGPLPTDRALALLDEALDRADAQLVPARIDGEALRDSAAGGTLPAMLEGLAGRVATTGAPRDLPAVSALDARLAAAPEAERHAILLDIVRAETATVLGHPGPAAIQPDQSFQTMGFDSLTSIELRNRLSGALRLRLPAALAFRYPTPEALARSLAEELADTPTAAPPHPDAATGGDAGQGPGPGELYRRLVLDGRDEQAETLIASAAGVRDRFEAPSRAVYGAPALTRLSSGDEVPELIALPPLAPVDGHAQFVRLAEQLRGRAGLSILAIPGFRQGEPLAATRDVLVGALVEELRSDVDRPFALLGYSSAGPVAHAVAERLESEGAPPAGVVLLDSYIRDQMTPRFRAALGYELVERRREFAALDFTTVTACGWYGAMFHDWRPGPLRARTLLVRPEHCVPEAPDMRTTDLTDWRTVWPQETENAEVPGDHCTMMAEHADTTAESVHRWLAELRVPSASVR
ncbi:SDR family NAD(P)-dependent oxidoreductase [Streptomyces sp. NPDC127098]|uniref:SDR family NAD(P)-dependent oxidoreductase n=1 Tax=Streptomyces sp. NPDC127098 TaxID=3347137 RepID=UPI00365C288B